MRWAFKRHREEEHTDGLHRISTMHVHSSTSTFNELSGCARRHHQRVKCSIENLSRIILALPSWQIWSLSKQVSGSMISYLSAEWIWIWTGSFHPIGGSKYGSHCEPESKLSNNLYLVKVHYRSSGRLEYHMGEVSEHIPENHWDSESNALADGYIRRENPSSLAD